MNRWALRLFTGMLCLMLIGVNGFALAEATEAATEAPTFAPVASDTPTPAPAATAASAAAETATAEAQPTPAPSAEPEVQYTAVATADLKVRRTASQNASGNGSISEGDIVYIIELGNEWSLVDIGRNTGYVATKYLSDIRAYSQGVSGEAVTPAPSTAPAMSGSASGAADGFTEKFVAYAYQAVTARSAPGPDGRETFNIPKYDKVTVALNTEDGWSYIHYLNSYGYVPTSSLFKWDRIDPYAGTIPGCDVHMGLAFLNHSTDIRSYDGKGNEVLKTVNPGSAVSVDAPDAQGRYPLPYWRTTGYITDSDISYIMKVVPWKDAQSGDLISCMSTFYAVGVHSLQYQGRNWNIYLGTSFISNTILQPGETADTHDLMGPYRASSGYHRAPIMSQHALSGFGGGCCQVNTTLYNALIQVPIYINWRKVHVDVGIYYCPVGFDAAVGGGDTTMIFTNTLPYAIRINYFMSDGCLTVGIFRV